MNDELYESFEQLEAEHWWFEGRRSILRAILKKHLAPSMNRHILDVGSGTGGMFELLSEFGTVQGAEWSADARERSHRRFPHFQVSECDLPNGLPVGSFDVLTCFDVLEHLDQPVQSLLAMRERLKPNGQLIITVPALEFLWSHHDEVTQHRRRYSKSVFESHLAEGGFHIDAISFFNSALLAPIAAARLFEKIRPKNPAAHSDLARTPWLLNQALKLLFSSERFVLARTVLPAGVSLVAVCHRNES
jgi:SAM-dependent methyltransferase